MMFSQRKVCYLLFVLIFTNFYHSLGVKNTYDKTSSSQFGAYVEKSFGMAVGGYITIRYSVTPRDVTKPYDSYAVIVILDDSQRKNWYSALDESDEDIVSNIDTLCNEPSLYRIAANGEEKLKFDITESIGSNLFSVAVLQCRQGQAYNPVTVSVTVHMLNARPSGDGVSHLPIQEVSLTNIYQGLIIIYSLMLLGLAGQFYFSTREGSPSFLLPIHKFFLISLVLKLILIALLHYDYYDYNKQGELSHSIDMAVDVFRSFSTTAALASLFLISLGWGLLREHLASKEFRFMSCCMFAYFTFSFASALCGNPNAVSCQSLSLVAFVIRSLILLAIIIALNFTVTQLRAMLTHTPWVPSTPLQYARCKQFQMFRMSFIIYLLLPTVFLLIAVTTYTWREDWVVTVMNELTEVLFYFHVGVTFSPLYEPLLIRSFDGSLSRTD